ncbi:MAG: carboxymuconolactone decarboxylase family protein, partial [Candidatus Methanosuratincola sp.]
MARIPYVEKESAPPDVRAVYEQIERKFGMVPNVLKAMAVSPGVFKGFVGFLGAVLGEDSIPAPLKELAILTTTKINGCRYCTAHHTMLGTRVGLTSEKIEALPDAGSSVFDEKERAVVRFASEVCER